MDSSLEKLLAEVCLDVKKLNAKVDQLLGEQQPAATGWAGPDEAATALKPEGVKNAAHLKRLRLAGAFSEAKGEIRDIGNGTKPCWQYNIPKCRTALPRHFKRLAK